jgi:LPXTG-site transpeptidase (sortase) family protein
VFNLLRKLDFGDRIHIFYKGETFIYEVVNKEVMKGWNTYPITRSVVEPILTLQTCDPPGTTINRLVVTAKLIEGGSAEIEEE